MNQDNVVWSFPHLSFLLTICKLCFSPGAVPWYTTHLSKQLCHGNTCLFGLLLNKLGLQSKTYPEKYELN